MKLKLCFLPILFVGTLLAADNTSAQDMQWRLGTHSDSPEGMTYSTLKSYEGRIGEINSSYTYPKEGQEARKLDKLYGDMSDYNEIEAKRLAIYDCQNFYKDQFKKDGYTPWPTRDRKDKIRDMQVKVKFDESSKQCSKEACTVYVKECKIVTEYRSDSYYSGTIYAEVKADYKIKDRLEVSEGRLESVHDELLDDYALGWRQNLVYSSSSCSHSLRNCYSTEGSSDLICREIITCD